MTQALTASVRMYRFLELGDCFLLTFRQGEATSRLLIDCGSFRNSGASKERIKQVVADIAEQADGGGLDVVVGTHQHNDHVSGFVHCEPEFKEIGIKQVWLPWLDDPRDELARELGEKHKNLQLTLHRARNLLHENLKPADRPRLGILDDMLGFYGAMGAATPPALPADAVRRLKKMGKNKPKYLLPGTIMNLPGLPAGQVKVYVLGPPRDTAQLRRTNPREGESYDHALSFLGRAATHLLSAIESRGGRASSEEAQYPFSEPEKMRPGKGSAELQELQEEYRRRASSWRTIDNDWLNQADTLALYLDSYTNNSSLVLAFELVESQKVFLFAADAQTGNWASWGDVDWKGASVSLDDLLARTVLYKVGHHGSHNATHVEALEKMNHPDLMCLIPVHKKDPNITKVNGWKMPARNLLRRLREKTNNRVLQMDGAHAKNCHPDKEPAKSAWKDTGIKPRITPLYMELVFEE